MPARLSMHSPPLPDEVTAEIFGFLGAVDTARCAQICRHWRSFVNQSPAWRCFVNDDFGLANGTELADWKEVYAYIKGQARCYEATGEGCFIQSRLVFCDDGGHKPGNNPKHALQRIDDLCWCTNAFVDKDVDLVADLTVPHLVMGFQVGNGGLLYSAPVKQALAFASLMVPNLEAARAYDGDKGIKLAHEMCARDQWNNDWRGRRVPSGHPLAGFEFPNVPQAFDAVCSQAPVRPIVARFVHFKLLTSSKCVNRVSNNIAACRLFTFGVPLPKLSAMIHTEVENIPLDPCQYARRHPLRQYPWDIHNVPFQEVQLQEPEVAMLECPMHRQDQWMWFTRKYRAYRELINGFVTQREMYYQRGEMQELREAFLKFKQTLDDVEERLEQDLKDLPPEAAKRVYRRRFQVQEQGFREILEMPTCSLVQRVSRRFPLLNAAEIESLLVAMERDF